MQYRLPIDTYATGLAGEALVINHLIKRRFSILGTRVRTRSGEIDVIARRGSLITFIEVKTSRNGQRSPDCITSRMKHRIRRAAVSWMAMHARQQEGVRCYRFDVAFVSLVEAPPSVTIIRNAF